MSQYFSMTMKGGDELQKMLLGLEGSLGKKIVRQGVRKGLAPTLAAAKSNAQSMVGGEMGGAIAKGLKLRVAKKQKKSQYGMSVGTFLSDVEGVTFTKGSASNLFTGKFIIGSGQRYYIPSAIEYGHAFPGRGGKGIKDVPAIPFMRAAADAHLLPAVQIFEDEVNKGIEAAFKGASVK